MLGGFSRLGFVLWAVVSGAAGRSRRIWGYGLLLVDLLKLGSYLCQVYD